MNYNNYSYCECICNSNYTDGYTDGYAYGYTYGYDNLTILAYKTMTMTMVRQLTSGGFTNLIVYDWKAFVCAFIQIPHAVFTMFISVLFQSVLIGNLIIELLLINGSVLIDGRNITLR